MNLKRAVDIARARIGYSSIEKFARDSGISPSVIKRIRTDDPNPNFKSLVRLADALQIKLSDLIILAEEQ